LGKNSRTAVSEGGGEREPTESEAKESVGTHGEQTSITEKRPGGRLLKRGIAEIGEKNESRQVVGDNGW
jgi:hypothetical protein